MTVLPPTLFPHLHANSVQPPVLLDEVIDQLGGLGVHQLVLTDSSLGKELLQVWVQILSLWLERRGEERSKGTCCWVGIMACAKEASVATHVGTQCQLEPHKAYWLCTVKYRGTLLTICFTVRTSLQ